MSRGGEGQTETESRAGGRDGWRRRAGGGGAWKDGDGVEEGQTEKLSY